MAREDPLIGGPRSSLSLRSTIAFMLARVTLTYSFAKTLTISRFFCPFLQTHRAIDIAIHVMQLEAWTPVENFSRHVAS